MVELGVGHRKIKFKIVTEVDVTVIPENISNQAYGGNAPKLDKAKKSNTCPGSISLEVMGVSYITQ